MPTQTLSQADAERRYWDAEQLIDAAQTALAQAADPAERARLMTKMHTAQDEQARVHTAAFGPEPLDDEGGRDLAESLADRALLYRLLADVETAVATPGRGRRAASSRLEPYAGPVLDRMAATPDLTARTELLEDLSDAVGDVIGGQAVETLWCLPSPGHDGWLTLDEKDAWLAERGYSRHAATLGRGIDHWLPRIGLAGVVITVLIGVALIVRSWPAGYLGLLVGLALTVLTPILYARRVRRRRRYLSD